MSALGTLRPGNPEPPLRRRSNSRPMEMKLVPILPLSAAPPNPAAGNLFERNSMKCPKCQSAFTKVHFEGIQIDRCMSCHGRWFDALELKDLLRKKGSESLDVGIERDFDKTSQVEDYLCPRMARAWSRLDRVRTFRTPER